jgi:hypothetical protein
MAVIGCRVVQNFGLQVLRYCIALGIKRARHRGAGTVHTVPMAASECCKTIELCVKGAGQACDGDVSKAEVAAPRSRVYQSRTSSTVIKAIIEDPLARQDAD